MMMNDAKYVVKPLLRRLGKRLQAAEISVDDREGGREGG
jgi:hypothetical protein